MAHDVIVVGGGIVGAACAFALRRDGLDVVLIDRGEPELAASWGNAGHFAYEQMIPLATPGLWRQMPRLLFAPQSPLRLPPLHLFGQAPWLARFAWNTRPSQVRHATAALAALLAAAPAAWRRLAAAARLEPLIRTSPVLVAAHDAAVLAAKRPAMEEIRRHGIDVEEVGPLAARAIEPMLRADIAGAFVYPEAQHCIDPARLTRCLLDAYVAAGGALATDRIASLHCSRAGEVSAVGATGSWTGKQCIVAAGIASRDILKSLAIDVPLAAERGYHLMVPHVDGKPRPRVPVICARPEFIITPMAEGTRLAGTVEIAPPDARPDWRRATMLTELSERIIEPLDRAARATTWMGCRPTLPDSLPVIGRMQAVPAVIGAFGHQHLGLTLSAITGEIVAAIVRQQSPPVPISPYSAARFLKR